MRPDQWEQLTFYNVDKEVIAKQSRREFQIAGAHAFRNNVSVDVARHALEYAGELFVFPTLDVDDYISGNPEETSRKQPGEFMEIGTRAIQEFEKKRFFKIAFSNCSYASTIRGYLGHGWSQGLSFPVFANEFHAKQERFLFDRVGYGDPRQYGHTDRSRYMWVSFGYRVPQVGLTTVEECVKTYDFRPVGQALFGELMMRTMFNHGRLATFASDRLPDGREVITFYEEVDTSSDRKEILATAAKRHKALVAKVIENPDQFALTDEDKEMHKFLESELCCIGDKII